MERFDITKSIDIALKWKYWIIIPFLASLLGGLTYYLTSPKVYEAETLILVQPQRVPEEYVRSIVSVSVEDRLRTIDQQVRSRTNLERIIQEFNLFRDRPGTLTIDEMVMSLRERILTNVEGGRSRNPETSTFTISFRDENPETVMKVTNALASSFISENLKIREDQALGTSSFLADELVAVERRLLEKENELKEYRERYMGGLPEQLETNLTILERLQEQLDQSNSNLRDAENRRVAIRTEIAQQSAMRIPVSSTGRSQETSDIQTLKNELASLEARYTSKHPDVIRLREIIANLEIKIAEGTAAGVLDDSMALPTGIDPALRGQLQDTELKIKGLNDEIENTKSQIEWYQKKVEETPKREQELFSLNRDYENESELYNSLLNRKLEAEIAVSMEKKQKGEQFKVIDPAKIPAFPIEPDMQKVMILSLMIGLGLGGGLAYLLEMMDTSYRTPEEVEEELQIPVLVSMPMLYTDKEQRDKKMKRTLKAVYVSGGFALSVISIVLATKGVDKTFEYVKGLFGIM
jgi:polysaccharide chain length determinant protein (PEP-CTERM system associated)